MDLERVGILSSPTSRRQEIRQVGWDVFVDGEWAQRFVTKREANNAKFRMENGRSG